MQSNVATRESRDTDLCSRYKKKKEEKEGFMDERRERESRPLRTYEVMR